MREIKVDVLRGNVLGLIHDFHTSAIFHGQEALQFPPNFENRVIE